MNLYANEAVTSKTKTTVIHCKTHTCIQKYKSNCGSEIYGMELSIGKLNCVTHAQREEILAIPVQ
jgi:hypothetical protein